MRTRNTTRKIILPTLGFIAVGAFIWYGVGRSTTPESDIISRSGFHWHPELTIYVDGLKQEVPANMGLGAVHKPIHTHEDNKEGIIHLEFQGVVRQQDIMLSQFFEIWGRDMRSFGSNMRMTVNGTENTEYENYIMRDKDKIELRFD